MKVSELIAFLSTYADPDATVYSIHTQYDGDSDVTEELNAVVYTDVGTVTICANNHYDRQWVTTGGWPWIARLTPDGKVTDRTAPDLEEWQWSPYEGRIPL